MKIVSWKNTVITASFLIAVGYAGVTLAHAKTGSLGSAASATDVYRVTCSNAGRPSHHLMTQVKDNAPVAAPKVSVVTTKGGASTTSTDSVDGNTAYSPQKELAKGSGVYIMSIKKSAAGAENYTVQFHCETAIDSHSGTAFIQTQNQ